MFKGHHFIKLVNENWVFDLTEFVGYKVKVDNDGNVSSYREAFQALTVGDEIIFNKFTRVPLKILKEASKQIRDYMDETEDNINE